MKYICYVQFITFIVLIVYLMSVPINTVIIGYIGY